MMTQIMTRLDINVTVLTNAQSIYITESSAKMDLSLKKMDLHTAQVALTDISVTMAHSETEQSQLALRTQIAVVVNPVN
jgi:hypothetical protein